MSKTELQTTNHSNELAQWSSQVADCRSSGLTVSQWCELHAIPKSTYYTRQRRVYSELAAKQSFIELQVEPEISQNTMGSVGSVAKVSIGDVSAEIHTGADEATLRALLRAMKSC